MTAPSPIGIVAGSGIELEALLDSVTRSRAFTEIPGLSGTTIAGHEGRIIEGICGDRAIVLQQGRQPPAPGPSLRKHCPVATKGNDQFGTNHAAPQTSNQAAGPARRQRPSGVWLQRRVRSSSGTGCAKKVLRSVEPIPKGALQMRLRYCTTTDHKTLSRRWIWESPLRVRGDIHGFPTLVSRVACRNDSEPL